MPKRCSSNQLELVLEQQSIGQWCHAALVMRAWVINDLLRLDLQAAQQVRLLVSFGPGC